MTVDQLATLVRTYFKVERELGGQPCLHRYRGIARDREVVRRRRIIREAREALERAVAQVTDTVS